ncbi:uncharacterized protein KQ657_002009 [Scheffersomyces spartinae]|uniref:SWI/SNF complex subunit SWI3 n=1 Tax=Scheffersomyces spartinae TaxID=45513 RepID=A0A9P7V6J1_9ASCO|nr:uncharacterized protein KQ657_002009 [Scheffersomyces spartinae]KAG7192290.1 hypothetical protein KQ657_002009 [Scheffersomyces spartinae]
MEPPKPELADEGHASGQESLLGDDFDDTNHMMMSSTSPQGGYEVGIEGDVEPNSVTPNSSLLSLAKPPVESTLGLEVQLDSNEVKASMVEGETALSEAPELASIDDSVIPKDAGEIEISKNNFQKDPVATTIEPENDQLATDKEAETQDVNEMDFKEPVVATNLEITPEEELATQDKAEVDKDVNALDELPGPPIDSVPSEDAQLDMEVDDPKTLKNPTEEASEEAASIKDDDSTVPTAPPIEEEFTDFTADNMEIDLPIMPSSKSEDADFLAPTTESEKAGADVSNDMPISDNAEPIIKNGISETSAIADTPLEMRPTEDDNDSDDEAEIEEEEDEEDDDEEDDDDDDEGEADDNDLDDTENGVANDDIVDDTLKSKKIKRKESKKAKKLLKKKSSVVSIKTELKTNESTPVGFADKLDDESFLDDAVVQKEENQEPFVDDMMIDVNDVEREQKVSQEMAEAELEMKKVKSEAGRQTHTIVLPSYTIWFDMKKIHNVEKESLPEFFNSSHPSKSPKIYLNYRNFMINSYRINPNEYITLTSCRRNLVGDVGTLMRVYRFLNKWGLINYQVKPHFKPAYAIERHPNGQLIGLPYTGDYHVTYDSPRGLFPFETYKVNPEKINIEKLKTIVNGPPTASNQQPDRIKETPDQQKQQIEDSDAFNKRSYPGKAATDNGPSLKKIRLEEGEILGKSSIPWTNEQFDQLVKGVKEYQGDWYKIAKSVDGNKTPAECILKFLQLPIEDLFNPVKSNELLDLLKLAPNFPVSSVDNPVMSSLVFMTQLVDPEVAHAATEGARKVMDEKLKEKLESLKVGGSKAKSDREQEQEQDLKENKKQEVEEASQIKSETKESDNDEDMKIDVEDENNNDSKKETDSASPGDALGQASGATFGIVGARAHLFANFEEREMSKIGNTLVNQQLSKIDLKLSKVRELEQIYEKERNNLARQQEALFLDRLNLTKSTLAITEKLNTAASKIQTMLQAKESGGEGVQGGSVDASGELDETYNLLNQVNSLLYKPLELLITREKSSVNGSVKDNTSNGQNGTPNSATGLGSASASTTKLNELNSANDIKPLSIQMPQTFKVWVP